jgi:hypothetical protein
MLPTPVRLKYTIQWRIKPIRLPQDIEKRVKVNLFGQYLFPILWVRDVFAYSAELYRPVEMAILCSVLVLVEVHNLELVLKSSDLHRLCTLRSFIVPLVNRLIELLRVVTYPITGYFNFLV